MQRAHGIDVNHFHPVHDWNLLAAQGFEIFGAKATNGLGTDQMFAWHRTEARKLDGFDLVVYYHFPTPRSSAVAQADHFAEFAQAGGGLRANERLALDIEWDRHTNWCPDIRFVEEFFGELLRLCGDRRAFAYTSARVWTDYLGGAAWPGAIATDVWLAHYGSEASLQLPRFGADVAYPVWPHWTLWQDSDTYVAPGIEGACDHSVFNGDRDQLRRYMT